MADKHISEPKAIIASTGRAGSGWIAKVLQAYGLNAGHEMYYRFPWQHPQQVEVDSSWLSVPHLSDYSGVVFHQIRNPLHVLTSLLDTYSLDTAHARKYFPFRRQVMPQQTGNLGRDFMAMIVEMNQEIEKHSVAMWRLERIDTDVICNIISRVLNTSPDYIKAGKAIESVSKKYNNHTDRPPLTWEQLEDCEEKETLKNMSVRYGYGRNIHP